MNSYSSYQNQGTSSIDPYYVKGDVFRRDQRYYDQTFSLRRNRTPNKGYIDASNVSRGNQGFSTGGQTYINQGTNVYTNSSGVINQTTHFQDAEQNLTLNSELQKLSYGGGQFGTGDTVVKLGHYTASRTQNATIRDQQLKLKNLQDQIRLNNQKLIKYQRASSELQKRMNNIQAIDKQIYKQLKGANNRDKQLLERANNALARGEPRESVIKILQQIVIS